MNNFNLSKDEYIVHNSLDGYLNDVSGEFTITNQRIIFVAEGGADNSIVKSILFSSIKNPKDHLQVFYDEDEDLVNLFCNEGQYEIYFDDFYCDEFVNIIKKNISNQSDDDNLDDDDATYEPAPANESEMDDSTLTAEDIKKGIITFAGIAKNVAKASINYIKVASENGLRDSENSYLNQGSNEVDNQTEGIGQLKKKLATLKEMLDEGLLSHDEYESKRELIMLQWEKTESSLNKEIQQVKDKPKTKKCPSCGELLGAFDVKCPTCGYEIHGVKNSEAIKEFQEGLNNIEKMRAQANEVNFFGIRVNVDRQNPNIENMKVEYIKNYVVPRTKEDLMEFMVLAKSNIETKLYTKGMFAGLRGCRSQSEYNQRKNLSDAWFSMMQQIYDKSKVVFSDDEKTYKKIESLYVEIYNKIM